MSRLPRKRESRTQRGSFPPEKGKPASARETGIKIDELRRRERERERESGETGREREFRG